MKKTISILIIGMFIILPSIYAWLELCHYAGPDDSNYIELTDFYVYLNGPNDEIELSDFLTVNFMVMNIHPTDNITMTDKGFFVVARKPDGSLVEIGSEYENYELWPGMSMVPAPSVTLDQEGVWEIWPGFESNFGSGPDDWHSCEVLVGELDDTDPPSMIIDAMPPNPTSEDEITFTVRASDPSGVARIQIFVNNEFMEGCEDDNCEYIGGPYTDFEGQEINYKVAVWDTLENRGDSDYEYIEIGYVDDDIEPVVNMTYSPENVTPDDIVTFTASATDVSGIQFIRMYVNSTRVEECDSSPCVYTGGPYPEGFLEYYATARDNTDDTGSVSVNFIEIIGEDEEAPTIEISHEPDEPGRRDFVSITARARDNRHIIEKIEVYEGADLVETCYDSTVCYYTGGPYEDQGGTEIEFSANAEDRAGNIGTDEHSVMIEVGEDTPPWVNLNYWQPPVTTMTAIHFVSEAEDENGINNIEIYINDEKVQDCDEEPCFYNLSGPFNANDVYTYKAKATDNLGSESWTEEGSFTIRLPKIRLLFVPLNWTQGNAAFRQEAIDQANFFINATGMSQCNYDVQSVFLDTGGLSNYRGFSCDARSMGLNGLKNFVRGIGIDINQYTAIVGITENSPCRSFVGYSNGVDTLWLEEGSNMILAHELGHIYGLKDQYCSNPAGSADNKCNDGGENYRGGTDVNYIDEDFPYDCPADGATDSEGNNCCNGN